MAEMSEKTKQASRRLVRMNQNEIRKLTAEQSQIQQDIERVNNRLAELQAENEAIINDIPEPILDRQVK